MTPTINSVPIFFDSRQLAHQPTLELHNGSWAEYAEKASRAEIILNEFEQYQPPRDHGVEPILRVHSTEYVEFLRSAHEDWLTTGRTGDAIGYTWPVVRRRDLDLDRIDARLGRYSYDAATPITAGTWDAAYWSAQTALTALDALINEQQPCAFALCRPPGHHAGRDYLGGYCYLNSAAITAAEAEHRGRRVAILDIDYHHGNGTQDIFYESADVLFASIHADPSMDYPFFWGHADECGVRRRRRRRRRVARQRRPAQGERDPRHVQACSGRVRPWARRASLRRRGPELSRLRERHRCERARVR